MCIPADLGMKCKLASVMLRNHQPIESLQQPLELTVSGRNSNGGSSNQPLRLTKEQQQQQTQPLALTSLSPSVCAQPAALPVQSVQMLTVIRPGHGGAGGSSRMMASQPRLAHNVSPLRNSMGGLFSCYLLLKYRMFHFL